jgi:hypothetical protein
MKRQLERGAEVARRMKEIGDHDNGDR